MRIGIGGRNAAGDALRVDGLDEIVASTGSRPDLTLARELRLKLSACFGKHGRVPHA